MFLLAKILAFLLALCAPFIRAAQLLGMVDRPETREDIEAEEDAALARVVDSGETLDDETMRKAERAAKRKRDQEAKADRG